MLLVIGFEMVQHGRLARVVKPHNEYVALFLLQTKNVGQLIKEPHNNLLNKRRPDIRLGAL